jgi:hypothetical protein
VVRVARAMRSKRRPEETVNFGVDCAPARALTKPRLPITITTDNKEYASKAVHRGANHRYPWSCRRACSTLLPTANAAHSTVYPMKCRAVCETLQSSWQAPAHAAEAFKTANERPPSSTKQLHGSIGELKTGIHWPNRLFANCS